MQDAGEAGPRAERDIVDLTREMDEVDAQAQAQADDDPSPSTSEWETDSSSSSSASSHSGAGPVPTETATATEANGADQWAEAIRELRGLKEQIDALEADMVPEFDALRQMIRRLRFATHMHNTPSGYTTGDVAFFSSMRRRFSQDWEEEREFLLRCEPYHLVFLANLLDFPAMRDRGDAMLGPDSVGNDTRRNTT